MNIKKIVAGSMLSMLMTSEMAAADWGDVYYCQMTNLIGITLEGEKKNFTLEKFQFKLDQTKNAMVFGSTGYFGNQVYKISNGRSYIKFGREDWHATTALSSTRFEEGKLLYTANVAGITSISADCDKF